MHRERQSSNLAQALLDWFSSNARDLPWRRTIAPYAIWISEIMLQQTQVATVIPYWERWMRALPDVRALAEAPPETVLKLWEGLGYYSRARNAQRAAREILARHGGEFPTRFEDVLALPGVGRYTAGAICSIAFNQPEPILDGNVARVLARVFAVRGDVKRGRANARLWKLAEELVRAAAALPDFRLRGVSDCALQIAENGGFDPAAFARKAGAQMPSFLALAGNCSRLNQALMELGALVCVPREPACDQCPLSSMCEARRTDSVGKYPTPARRVPVIAKRFVAFIVKKSGKFLVRRRPAGGVNAGFWEFPNIETAPGASGPPAGATPFTVESPVPIISLTHSITRHRIRLEAFDAEVAPDALAAGEWKSLRTLEKLPLTAAHRKILVFLLGGKPGRVI